MKVAQPYRCDECGTEKQESNHWYLLMTAPNPYSKRKGRGDLLSDERFVLVPWKDNEILVDEDGVEHLCSESCASKKLSKWMGSLKA